MGVGNTSFDKSLSFLIVLALHKGVSTRCKSDNLSYQSLSNIIKVDEHTSSCGQYIQCLIQITTKINLSNNLRDGL